MSFFFAFPYSLLTMALSSIISDFNLVGANQGMMKSMNSIGALAALISIFILQHKITKSKLLIAACGLIVLSLVTIGLAQTYLLLILFYFIFGLGIGYFDSTANSYIIDLHGEKSAPYLGVLQSVFGIGGLLLPFLYRWLNTFLSWRGIHFVVAGLIAFIVLQFIIIGKWARKDIEIINIKAPRLKSKDFKQFFLNRFNVLLMLSMLFFAFMQTGNSLWIVRYVSVSFNTPELGAWAFSLFWIFGSISRILSPYLKISTFNLFIWGTVLSGLALTVGVLMGSAGSMCVASALFGVFGGPCIPSLILIGVQKYPDKTVLPASILMIMLYIASTLISIIIGAIAQIASLQVSMIILGAFGIIAGLTAISAKYTEKKMKKMYINDAKC